MRPEAPRPAVTALVGLTAVGALTGVGWWLLVTPAFFTKQPGGGSMSELQLGHRVSADGWYAVLAVVVGLLGGVVLSRWQERDSLLTLVVLLAGSVLAAAAMALVGHLLGPGDPRVALAQAPLGGRVAVPLSVSASTAYLAWPVGAALGALLVLGFTDARQDGDEPRRTNLSHPDPVDSTTG